MLKQKIKLIKFKKKFNILRFNTSITNKSEFFERSRILYDKNYTNIRRRNVNNRRRYVNEKIIKFKKC